jgi:hypothetical protein
VSTSATSRDPIRAKAPARLASTLSHGPAAGLPAAGTMLNTLGNGVFLTSGPEGWYGCAPT